MLIGSRALAFWDGRFKCRPTSDWDVIAPPDSFKGDTIEIHPVDDYCNEYILEQFGSGQSIEVEGKQVEVCSLEGLAAIKRSHLSLDWNWDKHIATYSKWLSPYFNIAHWDWVKRREKITLEKARQRQPSLKQSVDEFFDDAITKKYSHDWLHELVAFYDKPLYTHLQTNPNEAWCDKNLWNQLTHKNKLKCVAEEASVIAIERWLVPSGWTHYKKLAYLKALRKVCTTLTSGWFRDFSIDHYDELVGYFRPNLFNDLQERLP